MVDGILFFVSWIMVSGFHTLEVCAVAGVYAHLVADVAEEGNADFGAGLNCGGFEGVGGGVALDARFGVGDLEHYVGGELAGEDGVGGGVNHCLYDITVLEELYAFDAFAGEHYLFPCFGVEEVIAHVILVGVLVGAALDAHFVYFHTGVPGFVKDTAGFHVAEFGAHESGAFTGFYVEEFHDKEVLPVDIEAHAVLEISCCCHKNGDVFCSFIEISRPQS